MSLLTTLQCRQIAFEWAGTVRVFRASEIIVSDQSDRDEWQTSDGVKQWNTNGVWLLFTTTNTFWQRVSPAADSGNDIVDVINALDDPAVSVDFYPIYDVDATVKIAVKSTNAARRLFATGTPRKGMFAPNTPLQLEAINRISQIPDWLRQTRTI